MSEFYSFDASISVEAESIEAAADWRRDMEAKAASDATEAA